MSLDVYLETDTPQPPQFTSGIFVREGGSNREISREEWDAKFPGKEPFVLSQPQRERCDVFSANITHNLVRMAEAAGIYQACWRPEEVGATKAKDIIPALETGLTALKADPAHFQQLNSENGWGMYENFVPWVERYLAACEANPDATIRVSR
jgi:hypothetical protein